MHFRSTAALLMPFKQACCMGAFKSLGWGQSPPAYLGWRKGHLAPKLGGWLQWPQSPCWVPEFIRRVSTLLLLPLDPGLEPVAWPLAHRVFTPAFFMFSGSFSVCLYPVCTVRISPEVPRDSGSSQTAKLRGSHREKGQARCAAKW